MGFLGAVTAAALVVTPAASATVTDPSSTVDGLRSERGSRTISYIGTVVDRPNLAQLGFGTAGHWFAQFGASAPVAGRPTGENAREALPSWVGAFNHTEHPADPGCTEPDALARGCLPTYNFRTFSQDGPARSAGGGEGWATLRLPSGECGTAGAIVDPHTFSAPQEYPDPTGLFFPPEGEPRPNNNNTINRIQLQDGVPATFFVGVVTDTTAQQHDPSRLEIRGNVGLIDHREEVADSQVEPDAGPGEAELASNGIPDVHVFRAQDFTSGDYLKLRLRGGTAPASFAGLLFDESFDPAPPPSSHPGKGNGLTKGKARGRGPSQPAFCGNAAG